MPRYLKQVEYDPAKVLAYGAQLCTARQVEPSAENIADALDVTRRSVVRWRSGTIRKVPARIIDRIEAKHGRHASWFEHD